MVDAKVWKDIALNFAGNLITAGWSAVKTCALLGLHRTAWYRHLNPPAPAGILVPHTERAYPNRITGAEAETFMELLNSQDYGKLSVTQAYYRMLDAGHCSFSIAAAHRIVAAHGQNGDRRAQRGGTGPKRAKPVVAATAPNQLWSWDITMLHGPGKQGRGRRNPAAPRRAACRQRGTDAGRNHPGFGPVPGHRAVLLPPAGIG